MRQEKGTKRVINGQETKVGHKKSRYDAKRAGRRWKNQVGGRKRRYEAGQSRKEVVIIGRLYEEQVKVRKDQVGGGKKK